MTALDPKTETTTDVAAETVPELEIEFSDAVTVYDSASEIRQPVQLFKNIFADVLAGRELAWRLFLRNLRGLYRQTALGLFWAFLPPIANTAVWVFLKEQGVFELGTDMAVNGTLYILTGMILWQAFIDAFQMPMKALNQNRAMISKLRFPRESLLMVGLGEVLFDCAIRSLLLIPAFLWFQVVPGSMLLAALPLVILMILFAAGLGMVLMPLGSLYQDVGRFISLVTPFWMILTPIIYAASGDSLWGQLMVWLNPAAPLLVLSRDLMLLNSSAFWVPGLLFAGLAIPVFLFGLAVFRISIPVIVERMKVS